MALIKGQCIAYFFHKGSLKHVQISNQSYFLITQIKGQYIAQFLHKDSPKHAHISNQSFFLVALIKGQYIAQFFHKDSSKHVPNANLCSFPYVWRFCGMQILAFPLPSYFFNKGAICLFVCTVSQVRLGYIGYWIAPQGQDTADIYRLEMIWNINL